MYFRKLHKKAADSLTEYALILGIVSLALVGMNTYIKRGVQGRIKDMADNFISRRQVVETDPTTVSGSYSYTPDDVPTTNTVTREILSGGAIKTGIIDNAKTIITRDTITQADPLSRGQGSAAVSGVQPPDYGEAEAHGKAAAEAVAAATEAEYNKKQAEEKK